MYRPGTCERSEHTPTQLGNRVRLHNFATEQDVTSTPVHRCSTQIQYNTLGEYVWFWLYTLFNSHIPGFDSRHYQIFRAVVGPEQGSLSLVSANDDLLERKSSGFGLQSREYGRRDPSRWPRGTLYPQKMALTSPTRGGRSVGIVR
jgi:hypothetical protein